MDLLKNKFLLTPVIVIALAFCLDKLLLFENVHTYFSKSLSDINYIQKNQLYGNLKEYLQRPDRKKVLVYFGNSRALLFDTEYIEAQYPGWTLFNFSVPGGKSDYTLQWMEKFKKDKVKPDFILFDHSVELYNSSATLSVDETLTNGLDVFFVLRHFKLFRSDEISTLIAKRMFRSYQFRPKLEVILKRAMNKEKYVYTYRDLRNNLFDRLTKNQGSAMTPGTHQAVLPEELLKKSARGDFHSYLVPFRFSNSTLEFLDQSIQITKEMSIPCATIWVRLSLPYMDHIRNELVSVEDNQNMSIYDYWLPRILAYQNKINVPFWNMNDDKTYKCNEFSDAGHMSPSCYKDYTNFIFQRVVSSPVRQK
ncbi:hypothetical protein LPTSP4_17620 [Leptospira ryugenii]|uniref:PF07611 family protein n=1 Tax=Leptospira ryugenii TaxID=1917863 RepID=A0A2P2E031_9LEPT|nr:DUF1574 domain-containing protein [Leptospira ryugenii]GBF50238.1 hypothetical protein LPTSP4_17620 [Leptospira ryugenii]